MSFLIYGATGYTGTLIAREAVRRGLSPTLSGRDGEKVRALANSYGFDHLTLELWNSVGLEAALGRFDAVLNVAGPFSATAMPIIDACLRTGCTYLDLNGDVPVLAATAARDADALDAGIMLMPAVGFGVVPSDCLASHVASRMPDAQKLTLAIKSSGGISRGTAKSMVESLGRGSTIRRGGRLEQVVGKQEFKTGYDEMPEAFTVVTWGDIVTAYHTTGIADIRVGFQTNRQVSQVAEMSSIMRLAVRTRPVQAILKRQANSMPAGPSAVQLEAGHAEITALVENAGGEKAASQLACPDPYLVSAQAAVEVAMRVVLGEARPGFQTPARMFGADFITEFGDYNRTDLD